MWWTRASCHLPSLVWPLIGTPTCEMPWHTRRTHLWFCECTRVTQCAPHQMQHHGKTLRGLASLHLVHLVQHDLSQTHYFCWIWFPVCQNTPQNSNSLCVGSGSDYVRLPNVQVPRTRVKPSAGWLWSDSLYSLIALCSWKIRFTKDTTEPKIVESSRISFATCIFQSLEVGPNLLQLLWCTVQVLADLPNRPFGSRSTQTTPWKIWHGTLLHCFPKCPQWLGQSGPLIHSLLRSHEGLYRHKKSFGQEVHVDVLVKFVCKCCIGANLKHNAIK